LSTWVIKVPNLTLAISEKLHEKMKKHSEIRWSEVVRKTISSKINDLELLDKLTKKSGLTMSDVEALSSKINKSVFKELNKR